MISNSTNACPIKSNDDQKPYMKLGNTFTPTKTCTPRESSFIIICKGRS